MSIGVHGESDTGMPKPGANRLDVCSLLEHQRSMGVPEVVKPDSRKTCSASNPAELLGNRGWSPGRAVRVTKYEVSLGRWDTQ